MKLVERQTAISGNLVHLSKFLRKNGFTVGTNEESDAMLALTYMPVGNPQLFKNALKAVFVKSLWQFDHFDGLYEEFWQQLKKAVDSKTKDMPEKGDNKPERGIQPPTIEELKSWLYKEDPNEKRMVSSYSNLEVLTKKKFEEMSSEEMRLIMALLRKVARQIAHQKSRLKKRSTKSRYLDLKRTFSTSMRLGGEILRLQFSEPKDKKLKIVLLCDVSKSMSLYSRFFVHLIYAFQNAYDRIETFVFSTALHRITDLLDNYEFDDAFELISDRVPQWSGGTTIGHCLQSYVNTFGNKTLTRNSIVFVLSDGWDTGDVSVLKNAMREIYKKSKKVIWLNPLAGNPNFSPEVTGLQTALPYIDVLASAHNLESLKRAMKHLKLRSRKYS